MMVAHPGGLPLFAPVLAPIGLILFLREVLRSRSPWYVDWAWGTLVSCGHLSWMASPDYVGSWCLLAAPLLSGIIGLHWAAAVWIWKRWRAPLVFGFCWALMEWSREFWFCGLLPGTWSTCLVSAPLSATIANLGGHWIITWWLCVSSATWALKRYWTALAWTAAPCAYGVLWNALPLPHTKILPQTVAFVQTGHWPDQRHQDPGTCLYEVWNALQKIDAATDLVVLPESAVVLGLHTLLSSIPRLDLEGLYAQYAAESHVHLIAGADRIAGEESQTGALWVTPHGERSFYAKQLLITGAEEIPFAWALPFLRPYGIQSGWKRGDYTAVWKVGAWNLAPGVCYEEFSAALTRKMRQAGAEVLLFLNNDGWYSSSSLAAHHAAHGRLRALELGCPVLQVGHTGHSGGWNAKGQPLGWHTATHSHTLILQVDGEAHLTPWLGYGYSIWGVLLLAAIVQLLRAGGKEGKDETRRRVFYGAQKLNS